MNKQLTSIYADITDFINTVDYLVTDEASRKVIKERISNCYSRVMDQETPNKVRQAHYKLLASYAIMGLLGEIEAEKENEEKDRAER